MPSLADVIRDFENKTGLPKLSKVVDVLDAKIPDEKQLRLFIEVLDRLERLAKIAPDIDKVLALSRDLNGVSLERLKVLNTTLLRLEHIMDKTPKEVIDFLKTLSKEIPK